MKFLITFFQIQDYGGIINHTEYLTAGLKELGHTVDIAMLVPKHGVVRTSLPKDIEDKTKYSINPKGTISSSIAFSFCLNIISLMFISVKLAK